ncbi:MAG TPA: Plug domain-containing protein, partial [Hyphomicrobium sp.]|nr:Plug domain-containing protein [Hyphomicrobium sp.]
MSPHIRRRALPMAVAAGISLAALSAITGQAQSQDAEQAIPQVLPEVNVIQDTPQGEQLAPKAKKKSSAAPVQSSAAKPKSAAVAQPLELPIEPTVEQVDAAATTATESPPANTAAAAAQKLETRNTAGSQLKLTPREMPATLNVVTEKEIAENGARDIVEVFRSVPGVLVGNNPGEPGSTVTRGIYAGLGYAIDGSRVTDPNFISRNYDSYNLERVEFLK